MTFTSQAQNESNKESIDGIPVNYQPQEVTIQYLKERYGFSEDVALTIISHVRQGWTFQYFLLLYNKV